MTKTLGERIKDVSTDLPVEEYVKKLAELSAGFVLSDDPDFSLQERRSDEENTSQQT